MLDRYRKAVFEDVVLQASWNHKVLFFLDWFEGGRKTSSSGSFSQ